MKDFFKDLIIIEAAGVLAGPSVGLFFTELGAKVIKIENPKTNGDVTRSWKLENEDSDKNTSAYYWSVNSGKEVVFLNLHLEKDLEVFYQFVKTTDVFISNYKTGDDLKLKVDYETLVKINPLIIYASINGFGHSNIRTAYDLILQAESGFMFMNGEKNSSPLKMPVALIDLLAGHQLKEAILIALLKKEKFNKGSNISVSLFDSAIASLANQATNWLIAHHLPTAQGSLHPNIAPYGEIFTTIDHQQITFAIGNDKQFEKLCSILNIIPNKNFSTNQLRVKNRQQLFEILTHEIKKHNAELLINLCIKQDIPIGKIRNLKEVFELPEAKDLLKISYNNEQEIQTIKSAVFKFHN
jgi:crotonobetainyl-CoA:carnitine CoA-transferase CaiB-like acyl-CoA transferase